MNPMCKPLSPTRIAAVLLGVIGWGLVQAGCSVVASEDDDPPLRASTTFRTITELDTDTYDAFGPMLQLADSTLLMAYRQGRSHVSDDGISAGRISRDQGQSWSEPFVIYQDSSREVRGVGGGIRLANEELLLFHRRGRQIEALRSQNGRDWSGPTAVYRPVRGQVLSAGNAILLDDNSLMRGFYANVGESRVYTVFSDNQGETWSQPVTVLESDMTKHEYNEASYVSLGDGDVLGLIRDEKNDAFTQVRSLNGGRSWTDQGIVPFSYGNGRAHPPWLLTVTDDQGKTWVVCLYANRFERELRMIVTSAQALRDEGIDAWRGHPVFQLTTFTRNRSGYPAATAMGNDGRLVGWYYDEKTEEDADVVVFSVNPLAERRRASELRSQ
jgi:hypothetical protein